MFRKEKSLILAAIMILTAGAVIAKANDDFCKADFDRLLKGDKNLVNTKLEGVNLKGMDLSNRNFSGADLENANLENTDLTNSIFKDADLESVNLKGAKITGTVFKGAELEFATWVDGRVCGEDSLGGCW